MRLPPRRSVRADRLYNMDGFVFQRLRLLLRTKQLVANTHDKRAKQHPRVLHRCTTAAAPLHYCCTVALLLHRCTTAAPLHLSLHTRAFTVKSWNMFCVRTQCSVVWRVTHRHARSTCVIIIIIIITCQCLFFYSRVYFLSYFFFPPARFIEKLSRVRVLLRH